MIEALKPSTTEATAGCAAPWYTSSCALLASNTLSNWKTCAFVTESWLLSVMALPLMSMPSAPSSCSCGSIGRARTTTRKCDDSVAARRGVAAMVSSTVHDDGMSRELECDLGVRQRTTGQKPLNVMFNLQCQHKIDPQTSHDTTNPMPAASDKTRVVSKIYTPPPLQQNRPCSVQM